MHYSHRIAMAAVVALLTLPLAAQSEEIFSPQFLVERLGSPDFEVRKSATEALRGLGEKARPALEAARNDQDLERRFRVRALLEDLDGKAPAGGLQPVDRERRDRFEEPQRQEPRRNRALPPQGMDGDFMKRQEAIMREHRELRAQMERMQADLMRQIEAMRGGLPPGAFDVEVFGPGILRRDSVESEANVTIKKDGATYQYRRGTDGKVRLSIQDPSDSEAKVYEAESLEALRKAHPEAVRRSEEIGVIVGEGEMMPRLPGMEDFRFVFPGRGEGKTGVVRRGGRWLFPPLRQDIAKGLESEQVILEELPPEPPMEEETVEVEAGEVAPDGGARLRLAPGQSPIVIRQSGPRLGVTIEEVPSLLRKHLKLEGKAMVITEVMPKTLAQELGLLADDLLLALNGRPVGSAEDVRAALTQAPLETEVTAVVLREGQRKTLSASRPSQDIELRLEPGPLRIRPGGGQNR